MTQTISRPPERHDDQPHDQPHDGRLHREQSMEWVGLYHREGAPVRPDDHPAGDPVPEDWGWHGTTGKWGRRLWVLPFALIAAYLVTAIQRNEGFAATVALILIAGGMLLLVLLDWRRRRNAWRSS